MKADLRRSLRRLRPQSFSQPLRRRDRAELPFVRDAALIGPPLLLDTTVYIDVLDGTASGEVDRLLETRVIQHCAIAVAELCHNFGRLSPDHPGSAAILSVLEETVEMIPAHRLQAPSEGVLLEAGILAGLLCRLGSLPKGQESAALNDAVIYLHALERGYVVLTRNLRDFDLISQIVPAGRVLFYDRV